MEDLITFGTIKQDRGICAIAGYCPDSEDFAQAVNDSVARLYRKGDWWQTLKKAQFCVNNGCIVWPRFVGRLRAQTWCRSPVPIKNQWYEFLPWGPGLVTPGCFNSEFALVNHGTSPVFRNVECGRTNIKIRAYTECQADLGKTITLYGLDSDGLELMTKDTTTNTWRAGISLVLAKPFVSTSMDIRTITRVSKPVTECPIRLFQYDTVKDVLIDMAVYEPSETEPQYLASVIGRMACPCPNTCGGNQSITALFKLALYPMRDDSNISPIQNLQAIKQMWQSIRAEEKGDDAGAVTKEARAVHEMNLQERDFVPTDQVSVQVATWGSARLEAQSIGWNI